MWTTGIIINCLCVQLCPALYSLRQLSYIQMPTGISKGKPQFAGLNLQAATGGAYDSKNNILYVIGNHLLNVIDIADPSKTQIMFTKQFSSNDGILKSVDICGGELAVAMEAKVNVNPGKVLFYQTYTFGTNSSDLTLLANVTVGAQSHNIQYTRNCRKLIVPNGGHAGKDDKGVYMDPLGTVSIINIGQVSRTLQRFINFTSFDYAIRVPSMYIPSTILPTLTKFSQDVEPEYVAISANGDTLWITLPEHNAIATLNITNGLVTDISALPFKDWSKSPIDASDEDGGDHRRVYSGLLAMRQPSTMKVVTVGRNSFLFTADEGAIRTYTKAKHGFDWTDGTIGGNIPIDSSQKELKANAQNIERLGRLQVSRIEGKNFFNEEYRHLFAFGGRGFSVWDTSDFTTPIYDSEGTLEELMEKNYRSVFNTDYIHSKETFDSPENLRDTVSDNLGAKVTALDIVDDINDTFLVVGTSSAGTLYLYTVDKSNGHPIPQFQHIHRSGQTDLPWRDLYINATAGDLYIRDIGIISSQENSVQKPLVYVVSSGSGSLSLYEIIKG